MVLGACRGPAGSGDTAPPPLVFESIGSSVEGRELLAATVGEGAWRVYWIGGIHGDEPEGQRELETLLEVLSESAVQGAYTVRVLADLNPDGTMAHTRGNARGVDLNRNFPARNFSPQARRGARPLSEPESLALWVDLERFEPQLVVVSHSAHNGPFVNYDGPAQAWAERFAVGAAALDPRWRVVADMGYPTPGSLGTAIGVERGLPILTLEFRRGEEPALVRATLRAGALALLQAPPPGAPRSAVQ